MGPAKRFAWGFAAAATLLGAAHAAGLDELAAQRIGHGIAIAAGGVLRLFYADVAVSGARISASGSVLRVTAECSGLDLMGLLAAAILAYPVSWRHRAAGAALVVPFVSALNVIRVASLMIVLRHLPSAFDLFHTFVWQGTLTLAALTYWLVWVGRRPDAPAEQHAVA